MSIGQERLVHWGATKQPHLKRWLPEEQLSVVDLHALLPDDEPESEGKHIGEVAEGDGFVFGEVTVVVDNVFMRLGGLLVSFSFRLRWRLSCG